MDRRLLNHIFAYVCGVVLLIGTGWFAHDWYHRNHQEQRRVRLKGFYFISPLLDVELPEGYGVSSEPIPFKYKIKRFVAQQIASGNVQDVAVYYRDLFDGPWFGINEKVKYNPASMMKVPVMIAWLKRAESNPQVLRRTLVFNERNYPGGLQAIKPAQTLTSGASYTVEALLHYMINYSDNKAMWLLYQELTAAELGDVLDSMDVTNDPSDTDNSISAHGYSGFFRILYNAAYLNREMSEKALQLLSLQDFPQGIVAGVPKGVVVAAKFGESAQGINGAEKQLHEFGIVYHPKGPYILGVMTQGHDLALQAETIRNISAQIYAAVDASPTRNK